MSYILSGAFQALSLPFTWLARREKTVQDEITATDVEDRRFRVLKTWTMCEHCFQLSRFSGGFLQMVTEPSLVNS